MTVTTGILITGKMSFGAAKIALMPRKRIASAITKNVWGYRKAKRTIPITSAPADDATNGDMASHRVTSQAAGTPHRPAVRVRARYGLSNAAPALLVQPC